MPNSKTPNCAHWGPKTSNIGRQVFLKGPQRLPTDCARLAQMAPSASTARCFSPETTLFAVDLDQEAAQQVAQNRSRLDVIKHAISNVIQAKRWACAAHKFGLITVHQDGCSLHPLGVTHSVDRILEALQALEPQHSTPAQPEQPFDLGSLVAAVQPLQQQEQAPSGVSAAQQLHGGLLVPLASNANSSSSRASEPQQQHLLRVVLVYCRSRLPAPVWRSHRQAGLAVDCLHVHDKPQPGEQQQQLQEVYSTIEQLVDTMSLQAGHASLIYECTGKNLAKLLSCMSMMLSHPAQRPPQALAKPPVDLALADLQPLPSDAANLASGVPIMSAAQLPPAAGGAWARPLGAAAAAATTGSTSTPDRAAAGPSVPSWLDPASQQSPDPWGLPQQAAGSHSGAAAVAAGQPSAAGDGSDTPAAATGVVTGVPAGCVDGVPDVDTPLIGMDLEEGVVVGLDASRTGSLSLDAVEAAGSRRNSLQVVAASDAELQELAQSLAASNVSAYYPKIS